MYTTINICDSYRLFFVDFSFWSIKKGIINRSTDYPFFIVISKKINARMKTGDSNEYLKGILFPCQVTTR